MSCAQLDCRNDVLDVDIPVDTFAVYIIYIFITEGSVDWRA